MSNKPLYQLPSGTWIDVDKVNAISVSAMPWGPNLSSSYKVMVSLENNISHCAEDVYYENKEEAHIARDALAKQIDSLRLR